MRVYGELSQKGSQCKALLRETSVSLSRPHRISALPYKLSQILMAEKPTRIRTKLSVASTKLCIETSTRLAGLAESLHFTTKSHRRRQTHPMKT